MIYQLSGSFHTLTHWQSGGTKEDTLKGYTVPGQGSIVPPVLSGDKVCLFPYAMKAKEYKTEYEDTRRSYITTNVSGGQAIHNTPVYGIIKKIEQKEGTVVNDYYYASIYYSPVGFRFEGIPVDYLNVFGDEDERGTTLYETKKGKGKIDGKEYTTYLATDKKHEQKINKDYTGPALLPVIQVRFSTAWQWYSNTKQIPQWVKDFCKDDTAEPISGRFGEELRDVTKEVEDEVAKEHPLWFQYYDIFGDMIPLYEDEKEQQPEAGFVYNNYMDISNTFYNLQDSGGSFMYYANNVGANWYTHKFSGIKGDENPFLGMNEKLLSVEPGGFILGKKNTKAKTVTLPSYWDAFSGYKSRNFNDIYKEDGLEYVIIGLEVVDDFKFFK